MTAPQMCEPITAGIIVSFINRYITSKTDFCYPCNYLYEEAVESDRETSDSSSIKTTVIDSVSTDVQQHQEHIIYDHHPYFLTIH